MFLCVCVPDLIKEVLSLDNEIQKLAEELYQEKSVLIMGRGYHYATCLEGALVSEYRSIQLTQSPHGFIEARQQYLTLFVCTIKWLIYAIFLDSTFS